MQYYYLSNCKKSMTITHYFSIQFIVQYQNFTIMLCILYEITRKKHKYLLKSYKFLDFIQRKNGAITPELLLEENMFQIFLW